MGAAILAVMIVRLQAARVPLERDEGEYALMGQLILNGVPPYGVAANMKLPGTYFAYSAIMALFGQTATGIRVGLLLVNLISSLMLYLVARRLLAAAGAAFAAAAFIITSVDNSVLGLFADASQFVVMFSLAGIMLLQESSNSRRKALFLWGSGLCFGLAVLMEQPGALFALFGFLWFSCGTLRRRPVAWKRFILESGCVAGGIVLPYVVVSALMAYHGVFHRFWFWTVDYALTYVSEVDLGTGIHLFRFEFSHLVRNNPVIWAAVLAGVIGVGFTESGLKVAPFLGAFFLFSFLSICPGLYFRPHYFVLLLPAAALYAGAFVRVIGEAAGKYTARSKSIQFGALVVLVVFSLTSVISMGRALAASTPGQFSRSIYGPNPFAESVKVAEYIRRHTKPQDRIAVLGSEPEIYFYAHRMPATEHIYMYGLMENQPFALRMQKELIAQVEKSEPPFIVLATAKSSWLMRPKSGKFIFSWMRNYISDFYKPIMAADIYPDRTVWLVGKEAESPATRRCSSRLILFRRKVERR